VERTKFASAAFTQIHHAAQNIFQPRTSTAFLYTHNTASTPPQRKKITKHSFGVCFPHGVFRVKSLGSDKSKQYIITYSKGVIYYITQRSVSHKYAFVREKIGAADTRSAIVSPFVGRFVPLETACSRKRTEVDAN
jgi:hypothetical protein